MSAYSVNIELRAVQQRLMEEQLILEQSTKEVEAKISDSDRRIQEQELELKDEQSKISVITNELFALKEALNIETKALNETRTELSSAENSMRTMEALLTNTRSDLFSTSENLQSAEIEKLKAERLQVSKLYKTEELDRALEECSDHKESQSINALALGAVSG
jgi:chromosome segregation ATPase